MKDLRIYLAGKPPASGDVSLIRKELTTKSFDE